MQELRNALRKGTSLEELWNVARGEIQYASFLETSEGKEKKPPPKEQPKQPSVEVPDDLVKPLSYSPAVQIL